MAVIEVIVVQFFPMIESFGSNMHGEEIAHTLSLTQTVRESPINELVKQKLTMWHKVFLDSAIINEIVTQHFDMHQKVTHGPSAIVIQNLGLIHNVHGEASKGIKNLLNMSQTVHIDIYKLARNTLSMLQQIILKHSRGIVVNQTLHFTQSVSYYFPNRKCPGRTFDTMGPND